MTTPDAPRVPWKHLSQAQKERYVTLFHEAGYRGDAMAIAIGAPSRSAVAGIVSRMRQHNHPMAIQPQPRGRNQQPKRDMRHYHVSSPKTVRQARVKLPADLFSPLPSSTPVSFLDAVDSHSCEWAVDGVSGPSQLFCGAPRLSGHRFCAIHHQLAWRALPPRRTH